MTRTGYWLGTNSGVQYWPMDPRPEDICIEDIAHHLSMICRFGGALDRFYSVAQHSMLCSELVPDELALEGLLHDACEAYLGDMVSPIKHGSDLGDMFRAVEQLNRGALADRFGLLDAVPPEVERVDLRLLVTEARDLFRKSQREKWDLSFEPYDFRIEPMGPSFAESEFLRRYREITGGTR